MLADRTRSVRHLLKPLRAGEWWEHKLSPMLGTGYMTAYHLHQPLLDLWPTFLATLVTMAAAAGYVSLVNDLTDRELDAAAGKPNRLADRSTRFVAAAIGGVVGVGLVTAVIAWRHDPLSLGLCAGPWLAFSLYSIPPVRLKARGFAAVLADASGAHLFPQALAAAAVFHAAGRPVAGAWLAAVAIWALAGGVKGALWHQLGDIEADRRAGVQTFPSRHPERAVDIGRAAFVIEMAALLWLLSHAGSPLALALVVPYLLLEWTRARLWGVRLIVVRPAPVSRIAMHEYYVCVYPFAFLVVATVRHPPDGVVLALHLATMVRAVGSGMARDVRAALGAVTAARRARGVAET